MIFHGFNTLTTHEKHDNRKTQAFSDKYYEMLKFLFTKLKLEMHFAKQGNKFECLKSPWNIVHSSDIH